MRETLDQSIAGKKDLQYSSGRGAIEWNTSTSSAAVSQLGDEAEGDDSEMCRKRKKCGAG